MSTPEVESSTSSANNGISEPPQDAPVNNTNGSNGSSSVIKNANANEDSDDDIPIGLAMKKAAAAAESDDDDKPITQLVKRKAEDNEDEDSEDLPLSRLKKIANLAPPPRRASQKKVVKEEPVVQKRAPRAKVKKEAPAPKSAAKKQKVKAESKPSSPKRSKSAAAMQAITDGDRAERLYDTAKGGLVQALLVRWWYAIEWPPADCLQAPSSSYEVLDGFPGVHICTSGDNVGKIHDSRPAESCPSLLNLMRKPTEELKTLMATAIEKQIAELAGSTTDDEAYRKELLKLAKTQAKVKAPSADKEADKVLRELGLV